MSHTISLEINNRTLSIEIGKIARQADGSALVRYGDTIMLVTATSKKEVKEPKPFLPLIADYRENTYAAGKIPGGFFKREGRPSEREILEARLIDRPIRPLFPEGYFFDTQIVGLLLSADLENEPDTLGVIGASAALYFSNIPFTTPIGAVKIGLIDGAFVVNPTATQLASSPLNMTVVGTEDGVVMIEAGAKEVEEERLIEGISLAHETIKKIVQAQKDLFARLGIKKREFAPKVPNIERKARVEQEASATLLEAIQIRDKLQSEAAVKKVLETLMAGVPADKPEEAQETKDIFYALEEKLVRDFILTQGKRSDGRRYDEVRPITIEVGSLPRTHGSAIFTRGETQSLATVTLGTVEDAQRLDNLGNDSKKRFMLHYNFPPFSVGEVNFLRGPGRREIGHGALAEKGILPSIPDDATFPYTIRIVSDILESNGSSSMATVCGGVLALMDAGVPLKMIVAGVAMGLVADGDRTAILTDIAGLEDHFGDMDFKVIGSEKGVTAIQMDLKIKSVTPAFLREAFAQSRQARLHVLGRMKEALAAPRPDISPYAPRIFTLFVNPERVSEVIGPAGKVIKKIVALTGAKIDIEDDGKITIASADVAAAEKAMQMIRDITAEAEIGKVYTGKVIRLEEYGAFVEILPNVVGLLHISEVAPYRIKSIRDVIQMDLKIKSVT
ncbi:MAG TPA: polyribonucleotide nucleotidyltransferase, partial [Acidobacteriota bacterium]|nr:polyribonucleotide nucleotidyltransferase [Acidobacteriota bacterium]